MNVDFCWRELAAQVLRAPLIQRNGRQFRRVPGWALNFSESPLVAVRKTAWRSALQEWEWLMYGGGDVDALPLELRPWWPEAHPNVCFGDCEGLVETVRQDPDSRRNILTTYTRGQVSCPRNDFVLQTTVSGRALSLFVYQRACNLVTGFGGNLMQFWAFGEWLARRTGRNLAELRWVSGDIHLYAQHEDIALKALRVYLPPRAPRLLYTPSSEQFRAADFTLDGVYEPAVCDPAVFV